MTQKTPREVLDDAVKILDQHGWTKGEYRDDNGCHCVVGAVRAAAGVDDPDEEMSGGAGRIVISAMHDAYFNMVDSDPEFKKKVLEGQLTTGVISYNDHEDTTYQDILTLLDKTLEHL